MGKKHLHIRSDNTLVFVSHKEFLLISKKADFQQSEKDGNEHFAKHI